MIHAIQRRPDGALAVVKDDGMAVFDGSLHALLDKIAMNRLSTVAAAALAAKKLLGVKRLVPLFLDADTLLIPLAGLRAPDCLLVNALAIRSHKRTSAGSARITFRDGSSLDAPSHALLANRLKLAGRLLGHLEKTGNR